MLEEFMEREKLKLKAVNRIFDNVSFEYEDVDAFLIENGMFKGYFLAPLRMNLTYSENPFRKIAIQNIIDNSNKFKPNFDLDGSNILMFCTDPLRGYYKGFGTADRPYNYVYCDLDPKTIGYYNTGYADWFLFGESAQELQKMTTEEFDEILMNKIVTHFSNEFYHNCTYKVEPSEPPHKTDLIEFLTSFYPLPEGLLKSKRAISKIKIHLNRYAKCYYKDCPATIESEKATNKLSQINRMLIKSNKEISDPNRASQIIWGE